MSSHAEIQPIDHPVAASRQAAKRHYGVHPYFTRRPYNVVRQYILHYSRPGDRVLDPFGGSGVTAIEAFLENREGVHNDINPLANFIAQGIVDLSIGTFDAYIHALAAVEEACRRRLAEIEEWDELRLRGYQQQLRLPENIRLPSNSDVERYYDLFSPRQLVSLAVLKEAIDALPHPYARKGMLLAWSATLAKLTKTFLSAEGRLASRGGSSIFSIYRYKIAKRPVELPAWPTFAERARNILEAKKEIDTAIELKRRAGRWFGTCQFFEKDIDELAEMWRDGVDYVFTDPPYGGHISYLDLSTLWNHWLDQRPGVEARRKELIVGGELGLSETKYVRRLGRSIRQCVKMLRGGRWLSVVFQHWNTDYFHAILAGAASSGAELKAAISQVGDPVWSMHKKKGSESVLAGELILTFQKTGRRPRVQTERGFDVAGAVSKVLQDTAQDRVYGEHLFNRIVMEAWRRGSIGSLNITKGEFVELIKRNGWIHDDKNFCWVKSQRGELSLFSGG